MPSFYKKLDIWQEAYNLVLEVYGLTADFPAHEEKNLVSQMRRAATSMPANIAEGASSLFDRNFFSHLSIAYASGKELENFLLISNGLSYIDKNKFEESFKQLDRLNSKIFNFLKKLELRLEARKSMTAKQKHLLTDFHLKRTLNKDNKAE